MDKDTKQKKLQENCKHNYKDPIRKGRAHYICRFCGEDITIDLTFLAKLKKPTEQEEQSLNEIPEEKDKHIEKLDEVLFESIGITTNGSIDRSREKELFVDYANIKAFILKVKEDTRKEVVEEILAGIPEKTFGKEYNKNSNCDLNYVNGFNQYRKEVIELIKQEPKMKFYIDGQDEPISKEEYIKKANDIY